MNPPIKQSQLPRPTRARVLELLDYDPETGDFVRRVDCTCGHGRVIAPAGAKAGTYSRRNGVVISIDNKQCKAHVLAWLIVTGDWPKNVIDHRDGDKANNKFLNLRDVTGQVNAQNMRKAARTNKSSGLLGVSACRSKVNPWKAQIRVGGRIQHLGSFKTPEAAHDAYVAAKREHHEGCTL